MSRHEIEDGMGFAGLAPTKAEREAEERINRAHRPLTGHALFTDTRLSTGYTMAKFEVNDDLSPLEQAQASLIRAACGFRLTPIINPTVGAAEKRREAIECMAKHIDKFFEALGKECAASFNGVDLELFQDRVATVMDEAAKHITEVAETMSEDLRGEARKQRRSHLVGA